MYHFTKPSKVYKITAPQQIATDLSFNYTIFSNTHGANFHAMLPFILHGDAFFATTYQGTFCIIRVKTNGQFCIYSNAAPNSTIFQYQGNNDTIRMEFLSDDTIILVGYYNSFTITIPNYFQNGKIIYTQAAVYSYPPCPCGAGQALQSMYFDGTNNVALFTYVRAFPEAYDLYNNVSQLTLYGFKTITEGYAGHYLNGQNPNVANSLNSPIPNFAFGTRNGNFWKTQNGNIYGSVTPINGTVDGVINPGLCAVSANAIISYGEMNCAGTGVVPVYDQSLGKIVNTQDPIFAGTSFKNNYQSGAPIASDVGTDYWATLYNEIELLGGDNFVSLNCSPAPFNTWSAMCFVNGYAIGLIDWWNTYNAIPYSQAVVFAPNSSLPSLDPNPVTKQFVHQLSNFHRPVSVLGAYKT